MATIGTRMGKSDEPLQWSHELMSPTVQSEDEKELPSHTRAQTHLNYQIVSFFLTSLLLCCTTHFVSRFSISFRGKYIKIDMGVKFSF